MARQGEPADQAFRNWFDKHSKMLVAGAHVVIFIDKQEHVPMLMIFRQFQPTVAMPLQFETNTDKNVAAALQVAAAQIDGVEGSVLLTEAWVLTVDADKTEMPKGSLANVPGRREIFMINAMRRNMQLMGHWPIDRERNQFGEPMIIDPMGEGHGTTGRFTFNQPTEH